MNRRELILGMAAGLSGCSALSSRSTTLNLTVFNQTDTPYTIELTFFQSGGDSSRSNARVYSESIDVEPEAKAQRDAVATARRYLIQYSVYENNRRQTDQDHVHYYPVNDREEDTVIFDIHAPGVLTRR